MDETVAFQTKVAMALEMVERALRRKMPIGWVSADSGLRLREGWRFQLERAEVLRPGEHRARHLAAGWSTDQPVRDLSTGWRGRNGSAVHAGTVRRPACTTGPMSMSGHGTRGCRHWVLPAAASRPDEIAYYLVYVPTDTTLDR